MVCGLGFFAFPATRSPGEALDHRQNVIVATGREIATISSPTIRGMFGSDRTECRHGNPENGHETFLKMWV